MRPGGGPIAPSCGTRATPCPAATSASVARRSGRRGPGAGEPAGRAVRGLFAELNPVVIKAVLHAQGRIPSPAVRLPLLPASPGAAGEAQTAAAAVAA